MASILGIRAKSRPQHGPTTNMGTAGMGKKGHLPSLENVQGEIRFIYNILVRTKSTKIKARFTAQNIPKLRLWSGLWPGPHWGS